MKSSFRKYLFPLSIPYRILVLLRNKLYDGGYLKTKILSTKVISVGNISCGGTGKTPLVELISRYILQQGKFVVIISKGYKRKSDDICVAELGFGNENAELTSDNLGDEALILLENLSYTGSGKGLLVVADNKTRGAKFANAKFRPDVIIIDDGFQHRKLSRDIDLVIINMADGKKLLPAGNLREPFSSLKRSDIVLVNNKFSNGNLAPNKIKFKIYIDAIYEFTGFFDADNLKIEFTPANALAFCGIADPASFRALLEKEYINVDSFLEFPDHHYFSRNELENIADLFKQNNCDAILTTQKDFVRIKYSQSESIREFVKKYPVYFSGINLKLLNESEKLFQKIDRLIT